MSIENLNDITLIIGSEEQFFERGRILARNIDKANKLFYQNIHSFEDEQDLELFKEKLAEMAQQSK